MAGAAVGAPAAATADSDAEEDGRSAAPRASSCGEEKRSWSSHGSDEDDLAVAMRLGRTGDSRQMAERESNRFAARAGPLMREDAPTAAVGGSAAGVPEDLARSSPAIGLIALAMIVELSRCRPPASLALHNCGPKYRVPPHVSLLVCVPWCNLPPVVLESTLGATVSQHHAG